MRKNRIDALMKRAGVEQGPMAHVRDLSQFKAAAAQMTDAQLLDAMERTERERITQLSDDELLAGLGQARQEEEQETTEEEQ